ncbi:PH domain-containing protein [Streptomyces sp. NRRL S-1868]|uniref:PH domain-containing protein n=1 Tax=Streptomyces sp. NRRL S-1868 TaxID=1463892 RepID=UPI00099C6E05|nr:PH domain-containing protein [Streptomyces sp. NRRL S-1868]
MPADEPLTPPHGKQGKHGKHDEPARTEDAATRAQHAATRAQDTTPSAQDAPARKSDEAPAQHDGGGGSAREDGNTPARKGGRGLLPARPEGRRLHPVTPWRRAWAPLAAVLAAVAHDVGRAREWAGHLTPGWVLLALGVLLPVAAGYGFLSWWCTSYLLTDTELRIRTGLFFRRTAHLRLDRVQAVDVSRPLLARLAGVAKLKLDVVGTESKDELAFLGEREAVALRAELLARAAGMAPEEASAAGEAPSRALLRVAPRTLVTATLLLSSAWIVPLVVAAAVTAFAVFGAQSLWAVGAGGVPLLGFAWSHGLGRVVREWDWTVAESPDGLRLDSGLLDRRHETVPPGRVQAVRLVEPLLWRRHRWVRVELRVAGTDDDESGVLIPVARREEAAAVLARVLPGVDVAAAPAAARPAPRRAGRCVPVFRRGYRHGLTDTLFVTRTGLLGRRTTLVPHAKVQSVRFTQGPWERRNRLANVTVDDGAGGHATARLRDEDEARALVTGRRR